MIHQITFTGRALEKRTFIMVSAANHIRDGGKVSMPGCTDPEKKAERLSYLITREIEHSPMMLDGKVVGHEFRLKQ